MKPSMRPHIEDALGSAKLRLPDFVIGGAPRSGTSWLYRLLDRHPRIYMAKPIRPEPKFFLVDDVYRRGLEFYSEHWFSSAPSGALLGEKSTNYLESHTAAERLHGDLPKVRLIFSLREPASRAWSNYVWSRMNGLETEDFATALTLEEGRLDKYQSHLRYARPHAYISRGMYADLLKSYIDLFPREQILCIRYEEINAHPRRVAERLHVFLGLNPRPRDALRLGKVNPSTRVSPPDDVMADLRHLYSEPNEQLYEVLGPGFERWESV